MTLRATTALAENTVPILDAVVGELRDTGVDISFDRDAPPAEREAAMLGGAVDVVWACGLLTMRHIAAGAPWRVVAAPVFAGELGPVYRSVIVARADDAPVRLGSGRLAVNEFGSWSGYVGFLRWLPAQGTSLDAFDEIVVTGSHHESALAVHSGRADVAAIDHTVWAHLTDEPWHDGLVTIARTDDWPAPPFSVVPDVGDDVVDALLDVRVDGLERIVAIDRSAYEPML